MTPIIIGWLGLGLYLYLSIEFISLFLDWMSDKEKYQVRRHWYAIVFCWPILTIYGFFLICAWVCEDIWSGLGEIIRSNRECS